MPRKKPQVFTRTVEIGPITVTITATGNPLAWKADDRKLYEKSIGLVNDLEAMASDPAAAGAATGQP